MTRHARRRTARRAALGAAALTLAAPLLATSAASAATTAPAVDAAPAVGAGPEPEQRASSGLPGTPVAPINPVDLGPRGYQAVAVNDRADVLLAPDWTTGSEPLSWVSLASGRHAPPTPLPPPPAWENGPDLNLRLVFTAFLNNSGQIAVNEYAPQANLWRPLILHRGRWVVPTTRYQPMYVVDLNDRGEALIVTWSAGTSAVELWRDGQSTLVHEYATVGSPPYSSPALAVNNLGEVAGTKLVSGPDGVRSQAFRWARGQTTDLPTPAGGESAATGINDRGQIAGTVTAADGSDHAVRWDGSRLTDLGTLGGRHSQAALGRGTQGRSINDAGQVVGVSQTADGAHRPFLWSGGRMRDIGTPEWDYRPGGTLGVDDIGGVVGTASMPDGAVTWLWRAGRTHELLPGPEANGVILADFSGRGLVVGFGSGPDGLRALAWRVTSP